MPKRVESFDFFDTELTSFRSSVVTPENSKERNSNKAALN